MSSREALGEELFRHHWTAPLSAQLFWRSVADFLTCRVPHLETLTKYGMHLPRQPRINIGPRSEQRWFLGKSNVGIRAVDVVASPKDETDFIQEGCNLQRLWLAGDAA